MEYLVGIWVLVLVPGVRDLAGVINGSAELKWAGDRAPNMLVRFKVVASIDCRHSFLG